MDPHQTYNHVSAAIPPPNIQVDMTCGPAHITFTQTISPHIDLPATQIKEKRRLERAVPDCMKMRVRDRRRQVHTRVNNNKGMQSEVNHCDRTFCEHRYDQKSGRVTRPRKHSSDYQQGIHPACDAKKKKIRNKNKRDRGCKDLMREFSVLQEQSSLNNGHVEQLQPTTTANTQISHIPLTVANSISVSTCVSESQEVMQPSFLEATALCDTSPLEPVITNLETNPSLQLPHSKEDIHTTVVVSTLPASDVSLDIRDQTVCQSLGEQYMKTVAEPLVLNGSRHPKNPSLIHSSVLERNSPSESNSSTGSSNSSSTTAVFKIPVPWPHYMASKQHKLKSKQSKTSRSSKLEAVPQRRTDVSSHTLQSVMNATQQPQIPLDGIQEVAAVSIQPLGSRLPIAWLGDDSSSSSNKTVVTSIRLPPAQRISRELSKTSVPWNMRRFVNSNRNRAKYEQSFSRMKTPKIKKVKKPEPYQVGQAKYKIQYQKPDSGSRHASKSATYKSKTNFMIDKYLKSTRVRRKPESVLSASTPNRRLVYRNFVKSMNRDLLRGLTYPRGEVLKIPTDPIQTQQFSFSTFPRPSHLIGFKNFGNTCYMNATLQALTGLRRFCVNLQSVEKARGMVASLQHIFNVRQEGKDPTSALRSFRDYFVSKVFPPFDSYSQQDSSEFLITLINQGMKEAAFFHDVFQFKYLEEIKCSECSKVTCGSIQQDVMLNLVVPKELSGPSNVQALLKNQLATCQACKQDSAACSYKFITLPKILVLVLKRYYHNQAVEGDFRQSVRKIKTPFSISHSLQVSKLLAEAVSPQTGVDIHSQNSPLDPRPEVQGLQSNHQILQFYHLSAVVSHIGDGTHVGHYLADVYRHSVDGWFHYNDETVSCSMFDHLELKENCYMLYYTLSKQ